MNAQSKGTRRKKAQTLSQRRDKPPPRRDQFWTKKTGPNIGRPSHSPAFWPIEEEFGHLHRPGTVHSEREVELSYSFRCRLLLWVQTWTKEDVMLWLFVFGFAAVLLGDLLRHQLTLEKFLALTVPFLLGRRLRQAGRIFHKRQGLCLRC